MSPTAREKLDKWVDKSDPRSPEEWKDKYEARNYTPKELRTKNRRQTEKEIEAQGNLAKNMLNPFGRVKADRELYQRQNKRVGSDRLLKQNNIPKDNVGMYDRGVSFLSGTGLPRLFDKIVGGSK